MDVEALLGPGAGRAVRYEHSVRHSVSPLHCCSGYFMVQRCVAADCAEQPGLVEARVTSDKSRGR